ncbi:MAG: hypothetical protein EXS05_20055 [Planctomycetaceae bacterium]|nr:hypothetical protein [Planctomycetaceae bacterium]
MPKEFCQGRFLLCVALGLLAGCAEKPAAPTPPVAPAKPKAPPAYDATVTPATADAAILAVIEGVKQKHPEALWHFLPESFQTDVNDVLHDFANRMDPEIWSGTVSVLRKLAQVARDKKQFLRGAMGPPGAAVDGRNPADDIENLAGLLTTLVDSDLGDLEKLKQADGGTLLAKTGGPLLEQVELALKLAPGDASLQRLGQLLDLKVRLLSSEGETAVVLIEAPDAEPLEANFLRVEGKWIPSETAHDWIETVGEVKARLVMLSPENLARSKPRWMTLLSTIEGVLDDLDAARDQQQFNRSLQNATTALVPLMGMMQGPDDMPGPDVDDEASLTSADLVTVVVRGSIDPADIQARLSRTLRTQFGLTKEQVFAESTGDDEMTSFTIGPVPDIEAFGKALEFLEVHSVDPKRRSIEASPKE